MREQFMSRQKGEKAEAIQTRFILKNFDVSLSAVMGKGPTSAYKSAKKSCKVPIWRFLT